MKVIICFTLILILLTSCDEIRDYFKNPETDTLTDVLKTSAIIGFSTSAAISAMEGYDIPNIRFKKGCAGFPCTSILLINMGDNTPFPYWSDNTGQIIVAGFWADPHTAILSILLTDFKTHTRTFRLKGIYTIPVIRDIITGEIKIVFASMDINLNPYSKGIFDIVYSDDEVNIEFSRIPHEITDDVYVAVEQDAWIISLNRNNTPNNLYDDSYNITGGGQLVNVDDKTTEVMQQAMVDVELNSYCRENPVNGYALIRKVKTEGSKFPELGSAILQFHNSCEGTAEVVLATGEYIGSNGSEIPFSVNYTAKE